MRTPLAWLNLTHNWRRLALAVAGVGFAVLLMMMELSFRQAMFDSTVAVIRHLDGDLILTSRAKYTIVVRETFSKRRLTQARGCAGVDSANPLYIETRLSLFKNADTGGAQPIRVLAFDPRRPVFDPRLAGGHADNLLLPDRVLFDVKSKPQYGHVAPGDWVELAGHRVEVVGLFSLGTDFANDGNLITSDVSFRQLFAERGIGDDVLDEIDVGVLRLKPGYDAGEVRADLERRLPGDVRVFTKQEFEDQERHFWETNTPIGYIFWLGTLMGFIVGSVICYQILYTDIDDHMPEFATLKAMGYPNRYFLSVVLIEALLLSLFGFLPGWAVSQLLCALVAGWTGLLVTVHLSVAATVLVLSMAMCLLSGCLTMSRVMAADPAELF